MTSTVNLDRAKIIGAISERFAPARLHVLQTELQDCAAAVVEGALNAGTQDACNDERLELLEQIDHVDDAAEGIRGIAGMVTTHDPFDVQSLALC